MLDLPAALRVKRRRESAAPSEIIVETQQSEQNVLADSLARSLVVAHDSTPAPAGAPARKRCRFVLLPEPSTSLPTADEGHRSLPDGPVLDLWHTPGLEAAAAAAAGPHAGTAHSQQQPHGADEQRQHVYSDMLQEFLQQPQQAVAAEHKQQKSSYKRPSKRSSSSSRTVATETQQQQQQQPQAHHHYQQQLPAYMTKGMLKQYGLWPADQHASAAAGAGAAHGAQQQHHETEEAEDMDYAYDVYVPAEHEPESSSDVQACIAAAAAGDGGMQQPGGAYAAGLQGLPVIQVGEEELMQLHAEWVLGQEAAGENPDSEDSNAEDHYANDYPEEEDRSYPNSLDSSEAADDEGAHAVRGCRHRRHHTDPNSSSIGVYQPTGSSSRSQHKHSKSRVESYGARGDSSESFDVEDYVSSGDEQDGGGEEFGPAWLRKHCVGYGDAAAGEGGGGQAWRSVLAQQFAPQ